MGSPRRWVAAGIALAVGGAGLAIAPPVASAPAPVLDPAAPERACGEGSWVAGTVDLCDGEVVYRDYVYDDFGPASHWRPDEQACWGTLPGDPSSYLGSDGYGMLPPAGDQRPEPANIADLVALRVRVDGDRLAVEAELNTLFEPDSTRVVVVVDTDGDTRGQARPLPGVASVRGIDWDEALVLDHGEPGVTVDTETNTFTGSMPLPAGSVWRLQALTALADGTPMNVAFRGSTGECGFWWENRQAFALARGDISQFHHRVEVHDLTGGVTRMAPTPRGEVLQRVYISEHPLGEGVDPHGVPGPAYSGSDPMSAEVSQAFNLLGAYQPYGFYLPSQEGPHGLQVLMHGLTENHSARFYLAGATQARITQHIGEARNRVLVAPTGRGWKSWYSSYSERDVFDVMDDVAATYPVDDDQVFASGYSMGGYGALRLAALYPDRFAGVMNWVGYTGDFLAGTPFDGNVGVGALGNALDLVGNLRHIPGSHLYAGADELVLVTGALALERRLAEEQVPSTFYLHPAAEHLTLAALDDWRKESADSAGVTRPARVDRVTYRTDERFFFPELDVVPNRAYWVSQIDPAGPGYADVDARSWGCGTTDRSAAVTRGAGLQPVPWTSQTVAVTERPGDGPANRIELTLANVVALHVDTNSATGACLGPGAVEYRITTDGPATVTLSDGRSVVIDGPGTHDGELAAIEESEEPDPAPPGKGRRGSAVPPWVPAPWR